MVFVRGPTSPRDEVKRHRFTVDMFVALLTSGSTSPRPLVANFSLMSDLAWAALSSSNSAFVVATLAAPEIVTWENRASSNALNIYSL